MMNWHSFGGCIDIQFWACEASIDHQFKCELFRMRQPIGNRCTFKSECNLWVTSVYTFSSNCWNFSPFFTNCAGMDTGTFHSTLLSTFDRFTRKVFSVPSLSWLLWWSRSFVPSQWAFLFFLDCNSRWWSWFIFIFPSFRLQFFNSRAPQTERRRSQN